MRDRNWTGLLFIMHAHVRIDTGTGKCGCTCNVSDYVAELLQYTHAHAIVYSSRFGAQHASLVD